MLFLFITNYMLRRAEEEAEHEVLALRYLITTLTLDLKLPSRLRFFLVFLLSSGGKKLCWTSMFLCRTILKEGLLLPEPSILSSHYSFLISSQQVHPKGEPLL